MKILAIVKRTAGSFFSIISWVSSQYEDCQLTRIWTGNLSGKIETMLTGDMPGPMEGEIAYLIKEGWERVL